jgi:primary-amine oxidase
MGLTQHHPFDPLSGDEIAAAVEAIRKYQSGQLLFNAVTTRAPQEGDVEVA